MSEERWIPAVIRGTPPPGFPKVEEPCLKCRGNGVELIDITPMQSAVPHFMLGASQCDMCYGTGKEIGDPLAYFFSKPEWVELRDQVRALAKAIEDSLLP